MNKIQKQDTCKPIAARQKVYKCHFELSLDIIGGKWKTAIIYYLASEGTLRFSELRRHIPEVSERMLIKQLRELEIDAIIHREVYKIIPPKVEYSLSNIGRTLIPIMDSLYEWGREYEKVIKSVQP